MGGLVGWLVGGWAWVDGRGWMGGGWMVDGWWMGRWVVDGGQSCDAI